LSTAAAANPALYRWSLVPQGQKECDEYIDTALRWKQSASALPFAIIRKADGAVVGAADFIPRDSARFSIIGSEWPTVKAALLRRLEFGRFTGC
jgi:hypothetical protein